MVSKKVEVSNAEDRALVKIRERRFVIIKRSVAVFCVIAMCVGMYFLGGTVAGNRVAEEFRYAEESKPSVEKLDRTVSGKTASEDRADAVRVLQTVLQDMHSAGKGKNLGDRLNALDRGDFSGVPDSVKKRVRFNDYLEKNSGVQTNMYQALVTLEESTFLAVKDEKFSPDESLLSSVYADPETGRVFVPLNVFNRSKGAVSVEMVFVKGEWVIDPYSFMETIHITARYQKGSTPQVAPGQE